MSSLSLSLSLLLYSFQLCRQSVVVYFQWKYLCKKDIKTILPRVVGQFWIAYMRAVGVGILVGLNIIEECHNCHICLEWGSHFAWNGGAIWKAGPSDICTTLKWFTESAQPQPPHHHQATWCISRWQHNSGNSTQLMQLNATTIPCCISDLVSEILCFQDVHSCNLFNLQTQNICALQAYGDLSTWNVTDCQMYF